MIPKMLADELVLFGQWLDDKRKKGTRSKLIDSTKQQYLSQLRGVDIRLSEDFLQALVYQKKSLLFNASLKNFLLYKHESGVLTRQEYVGILKGLDFTMLSSMHDSKLTFEVLKGEIINPEELKTLFSYSVNKMVLLIMRVLYDSACRKAEILYQNKGGTPENHSGLVVDDVLFLPNGSASIKIQGKGYGVKSRTVFLESDTVEMVKEYIQENKLGPKDPLFQLKRKNGLPYKNQGDALWNVFVKLGKNLVGRPIKPHSFRHTKLTDMVNAGARIEDVQSYAGHADITTTRIYAKMSEVQSKRGFDASRRIKE